MPLSASKKHPSKPSANNKDQMTVSKSRISRPDIGGGDMDWMKGKIYFKPDDQLQLSELELQEEIARVLMIHNTRIPDALVEWSWKKREFIRLPNPPHLVTLLNVSGTLLHKESDEAKIQMSGGVIADIPEEPIEQQVVKKGEKDGEEKDGEGEEEEEEISPEDETEVDEAEKPMETQAELEQEADEEEVEKTKPKKVPNQFNFCERAALTYNNPVRDMSTQTVPPPTASFNAHVFQWIIFDEYQA